MSKIITLEGEEGMLIDWLLTMHSYSQEYLDWAMTEDFKQLRYQAGNIILDGKGLLEVEEGVLDILLAITPITFRFGTEDVGYSLKKKLYDARLVRFKEIKKNASNSSSKNNAENQAEGSAGATEESISS